LSSKLYMAVELMKQYASMTSSYVLERELYFEQYGADSKCDKETGSATWGPLGATWQREELANALRWQGYFWLINLGN
jgi:hypothetical protein